MNDIFCLTQWAAMLTSDLCWWVECGGWGSAMRAMKRSTMQVTYMAQVLKVFCIAVVVMLATTVSFGDERVGDIPLKLIGALLNIDGSYAINAATKKIEFNNKVKLAETVSSIAPEKLVPQLIACMDDERNSKVKYRGKAVPLGMLCYEALTFTVYYEPTDARGDVAKHWPGYLKSGDISLAGLRAAKRAWEEVARKKAYVFL